MVFIPNFTAIPKPCTILFMMKKPDDMSNKTGFLRLGHIYVCVSSLKVVLPSFLLSCGVRYIENISISQYFFDIILNFDTAFVDLNIYQKCDNYGNIEDYFDKYTEFSV